MNWLLLLNISKTLLLARVKQSVVAAAGVTFGIAMYISMMGFMTGLNGLLDGLVLNRTPHILLYNEIQPAEQQPVELSEEYGEDMNIVRSIKPLDRGKGIYNAGAIMQALRKDNRVLGIAAKANATVLYNAGSIEINGAVNGIEVLAEDELFAFSDYVVEGDVQSLLTINNSIILGKGLANKMLIEIGDMVQVTTVKGSRLSLKVVGFYQSGLAEFDNVQSFASLVTAQKLLGEPASYLTDIQVKLKDMEMAPQLGKEYSRLFGVDARDIQTANAQFETGTQIRNVITYAVSFTLLLVAGFGIYNILNMMIYEKMDSIAILKATGFNSGDVKKIFIFLSLIIGFVGGGLGLLLGYTLQVMISKVPFETEALPTIKTMPVNFSISYHIIGISFALVTTYLAGFLPARKASKVDPVEIIRGK